MSKKLDEYLGLPVGATDADETQAMDTEVDNKKVASNADNVAETLNKITSQINALYENGMSGTIKINLDNLKKEIEFVAKLAKKEAVMWRRG